MPPAATGPNVERTARMLALACPLGRKGGGGRVPGLRRPEAALLLGITRSRTAQTMGPLKLAPRILGLAYLATDIAETIMRGEEASGMLLEALVKAVPVAWEEKRTALGLSLS